MNDWSRPADFLVLKSAFAVMRDLEAKRVMRIRGLATKVREAFDQGEPLVRIGRPAGDDILIWNPALDEATVQASQEAIFTESAQGWGGFPSR